MGEETKVPPLPKGYQPIAEETLPPLPEGFSLEESKKKSTGTPSVPSVNESGSAAPSTTPETKYKYTWSDSQPLKTASVAPHPEVPQTKVQTINSHTSEAAIQNPNLYVSSPNAKINREQYISSLNIPKEEQAKALADFDKYAESLKGMRTAYDEIKKDPNNPNLQIKLVDGLVNLNKPEEAQKQADEIIAKFPDYSPAYNYKASIEAQKGNYSFANDIITQGIEANPNDASLFNNRAAIKIQAGDPQGAIRDLDLGIAMTQNPHLLENMWVQKATIFNKLMQDKTLAQKYIDIINENDTQHDATDQEFFLNKYQEAFKEANKYAAQNAEKPKEVTPQYQWNSTDKKLEEAPPAVNAGITTTNVAQASDDSAHEQKQIQNQAELVNKIVNPDKPLTNYILEYAQEHGEQVAEGVKQAGKGLKHGGAEGLLDVVLGSANAAMGVASLAVPEVAGFNVIASAAPEDLNKWAFSPITSIVEKAGYKPVEGSVGEKGLQTADLLLTLAAFHKLSKGKEIEGLDATESKLKNGEELSKEDAKPIADLLNEQGSEDNINKAVNAIVQGAPESFEKIPTKVPAESKPTETVTKEEIKAPVVEEKPVSAIENQSVPEQKVNNEHTPSPQPSPAGEGVEPPIESAIKKEETAAAPKQEEINPIPEGEQKKSLISRVYEGKTPEEIKTAVEKHGLNYTIETHPQAERLASDFVKEVGIDNALEAVRHNEVEGGAAPFVWAKAVDAVYKEYLTEKNPETRLKLAEKEAALLDEFEKKGRSSGRFNSAQQAVYQVSDLGYKLGSILNRAKDANLGEGVPEILKGRLADLSTKLDEVNQKMAEREKAIEIDSDTKIAEEVDKVVKTIYEKLPTERRKKADKAIAVLEGMQAKLRSNAYSSIVPIPIIDAGISVIKSAIKAGVNIADAVELGINHIKERYGKDWERESDFRKDVLDEFKTQNIDFKKQPRDASELEKYKGAIRKSIEKQRKKLSEKDFSKKSKSSAPALDKEAFDLLVEKNKLKDEIDTEIEKLRLKNRPMIDKVEDNFIDVINLPKSLMASADLSAPLRQGAVLGAAHPIIASKTMVEMFRQAFSEKKAIDWLTRLRASPEYQVMKDSGLYISEPTAKLSAKEEQFISNIAHKIPIWGKVVKGSERAYTGYLNKLRVDVFSQFHDGLVKQGIKGEELKRELESFADFVNNASGRGNLGRFEDSAAGLNAVFFSPRYAVSRFNLINPYEYIKMAPKARAEALKTLGVYIGMGSTVLALAQAAGAKVVLDPRSSDFGKIRIGDTRFDIWSGFQQWVRLIAQITTGQKTDLQGKTKELGKGYKSDTRLDLIGHFLRFKASPALGTTMDALAGKDAGGNEVSYKFKDLDSFLSTEEGKLIVPLYLQDLKKAAESENAGVGAAGALGSFFGAGVSTYPDKKPDNASKIK